ncbi:DMT family transporter [Sphingobium sp. PNB]|uniref:DMT family transporter n=1 Tax=Sphingobium sp. PNB TaxID=863934 RepID=UPI001CA43D9B|nr:DMT family transporter [Sphingobium sp. PNB]MCB4859461.1 DMT family transporter [Sphingobium sp. PNB]
MRSGEPIVGWPGPDGVPPQVEAAAERPASPWRPIGMILCAVFLFSISDVFAKGLGKTLPGFQVAWLRYLLFFMLAAMLAMRAGSVPWRSRQPGLQSLRALCLLLSASLFLLGLGRLPVAEATAISFATPAFVTMLSVPLLGEVVRRRRWTAMLLGLAGVLIVVRPGAGAFAPSALLPLGSALCGALGIIVTRRIGDRDPLSITLFWSSGLGLLVLTSGSPLWFTAMDRREVAAAALMGLLYAAAQLLLILAYRRCEASFLAPFSYAQVLFATLVGYLAFGTLPDGVSLLGIALVTAGGAYTLRREGFLGRLRLRGGCLLRRPGYAGRI